TNDDAVFDVALQTLLAERFHLALHRETRTIQAYVLETGKGGAKFEKDDGGEGKTDAGHGRLNARNTSMDHLAEVLSRGMDLPVVNRTGLEGVFKLKLEWTPEKELSRPNAGPSIFTAIQEQLGLRLRSAKAPVEVLVIDRAEKPTEN
ncbi:MAG TPA: TIGR03435 family protein, partial [Terracidiphilus sp.]|nr:TIGR03435 family protein [Terracidiphilus sp.]